MLTNSDLKKIIDLYNAGYSNDTILYMINAGVVVGEDKTAKPSLTKGVNTRKYVHAALVKSGYTDGLNECLSCRFDHINKSGSEVHEITFKSDDEDNDFIETGYVYIDKNGKADY